MRNSQMTMIPGTYYVGDLCYVAGCGENKDKGLDWDQVCALTIVKDYGCISGEFNLPDGRRFAMYGTAWGDGCYRDRERREYCVDSGTIGCIRIEDLGMTEEEVRKELLMPRGDMLGQIIEFAEPFTTECDGKVIYFGTVAIDTDPEPDCDYCGDTGHEEWECPDREDEDEEED